MADKNIKLGFSVDHQSFLRMQNAIKSLTSDLQKMNVAGGAMLGGNAGLFSGIPINIGGVGTSSQPGYRAVGRQQPSGIASPTMGKTILDNAAAFKKFAATNKDASKIMTDALKRDISTQEKALDGLNKKLSDVSDRFKWATQKQKEFLSVGNEADASRMGRYIDKLEGKLADTSGKVLQSHKNLGASQQQLASMGGPGGFLGSGTTLGNAITSAMSGNMSGLASIATKLAPFMIAAAGAKAIYNEVREGGAGPFGDAYSGGGMDARAFARRGRLVNSRVDALRRGDASQLLLQNYIQSDKAMGRWYNQGMDLASELEAYGTGAQQAVGKIPIVGKIGQWMGLAKGSPEGALLESMTPQEIQSKLLENMQAREAEFAQHADFRATQRGYEYFNQTYGDRLSARRIMGLTTEGVQAPRFVNGKFQYKTGFFGNLAQWAAHEQVGVGQVLSNYAQIRQMGGANLAGQLAKYETLSQAGGYGGFGALAAQALRGAGNESQAISLAQAALGGGIGVSAGMQLGNAIFGYNPEGTVSGAGMLQAIQNSVNFGAMGAGQQFNKVQSLTGAMELGNRIMKGGLDPNSLAANTLSSMKILGAGANTRAIDYLAGMDPKIMLEVMKNKNFTTEQMDVYGITRGQVGQEFRSSLSNLLTPQLANSAVSGTVRKVLDQISSGKDLGEIRASLSATERKQLDVALSSRTGAGIEIAKAFNDISFGGTKGNLKKGGALGSKLSGVLAASGEREATIAKEDEANIPKNLADTVRKTVDAAKAQENFGKNLEKSTTDLIVQLQKLTPNFKALNDTLNTLNKSGFKAVPGMTGLRK